MIETTDKATIFTSRRECLIASVGDSRSVWATCIRVRGGDDVFLYGLARTEHQFRMAVAEKVMASGHKYTKDELQAAMAEEMKAMAKGGDA